MTRSFDAIIVGAGQAGPPLAGRLTAAGMAVALIERHLRQHRMHADTQRILGAAILGTGGDEAIHGVLDMMSADQPVAALRWAVPIHPTVSELIPTLLVDLKPSGPAQ